MRTAPLLIAWLVGGASFAADMPNGSKRAFPAKVHVASSRPIEGGRVELDVRLVMDKGVEIYAPNPASDPWMKDGELKVSVIGTDGKAIPADIIYPKPTSILELEDGTKFHLLSGTASILVRITPQQKLKVRCDVVGMGQRVRCLGVGRLEADIP